MITMAALNYYNSHAFQQCNPFIVGTYDYSQKVFIQTSGRSRGGGGARAPPPPPPPSFNPFIFVNCILDRDTLIEQSL